MTRLQKKCLVGAAGTHLLIIVALLCSGFIKSSPKVDNADVLTAIPANIVENALNTGVQNAPPPTPTPPQPPTPPTPPTPAVTTPTPPVPTPPPITRPVEPVKPVEPEPDKTEVTPTPKPPKPPKPAPPKIVPDLKPVVKNPSQNADDSAAQARAEKLERQKRQKAIQDAMRSIEHNSSSSTEVAVPQGNSTAAVANYASVVKTVYTDAWMPPDGAQNDEANVKVKVTIQNDGTVISARIIERSGDNDLDQSVQQTLDRIQHLEPFPEGMTDKERTYIINFNLKAKRQAG